MSSDSPASSPVKKRMVACHQNRQPRVGKLALPLLLAACLALGVSR